MDFLGPIASHLPCSQSVSLLLSALYGMHVRTYSKCTLCVEIVRTSAFFSSHFFYVSFFGLSKSRMWREQKSIFKCTEQQNQIAILEAPARHQKPNNKHNTFFSLQILFTWFLPYGEARKNKIEYTRTREPRPGRRLPETLTLETRGSGVEGGDQSTERTPEVLRTFSERSE